MGGPRFRGLFFRDGPGGPARQSNRACRPATTTMKKFVLALTAAAAFAALPSFALAAPGADPQTAAAVKAMFDAMEIRKNMNAMYAGMQQALPALMRQQLAGMLEADARLSPEKKKQAMARAEQMLPHMVQSLGKIFSDPSLVDEMIDEMVPLYASNYTVEEIRQLTAFYQTPLGRKMLALTPKLGAEGMAIGQRLMMPRVSKLMSEMAQDVQKP